MCVVRWVVERLCLDMGELALILQGSLPMATCQAISSHSLFEIQP
jgi:hypothetical protein